MRIALIETAPPDTPGSMRRYVDLIERAMAAVDADGEFDLHRINCAPCDSELKRWPVRFRSWVHHATVAVRARRLAHHKFDLLHIIDGSHAYVAQWLPSERTIATAHDLIPLLQSQGRFAVPAPGVGARWLIGRSLRGLAHCHTVIA